MLNLFGGKRCGRTKTHDQLAAAAAGALALFGGASAALADVNGFTSGGTNPTQFTLNGSVVPTISGTDLNLTPNAGSVAASAFYNTPQSIDNWTATFTYTKPAGTNPPADGFAFVLQNDPRGPTALGGAGGAIGYGGIVKSAAGIAVDFYNGGAAANPSLIGTGRNGDKVDLVSSLPIAFRDARPLNVTLTYNTGVLTQTVVDPTLAAGANTYTRTLNRNFTGYIGGNSAFVGFTGGTGGATAQQTIGNFNFTTGTAPAVAAAGPLLANVPQGGAGFFGVREVSNNGTNNNVADAIASLTTQRGATTPRVVDATTPSVDTYDSDIRGDFPNDRPFASAAAPAGPGVGNVDQIAVVSTGRIRVATAGYQTFSVRSDDGFRLSIAGQRFESVAGQGGTAINENGALQFDAGRGAGIRSFGQIYLPAGDHDIQLIHFEGAGGASAELSSSPGQKTAFDFSYNLVGGAALPTPRRAPRVSAAGWQVANFNGNVDPDGTGPLTTLDSAITSYSEFRAGTRTPSAIANNVPTIFYSDATGAGGRGITRSGQADFGNDRNFPNDTAADDNDFATGARATMTVTNAGRYTFDVLADDLTRLRITDSGGNDVDIAGTLGANGANSDGDAANDALRTTGCCADAFGYWDLPGGDYTIELIHQEGGGGASLALFSAFGTYDYFDPAVFQLLGQNIDATSIRDAGLQLVAVPEPTTFGMLGLAAVGLLARRRRSKSAE